MIEETQTEFSPRRLLLVGFLTLVVLLGGFGAWAGFTSIAGAVVSSGQVRVDQNRQVVQHPDGGVVSSIEVQEGDMVEAGQVLLRRDRTLLETRFTILKGQFFELIARRGRLEAERDGTDRIGFDPLLEDAASASGDIRALMEGQVRLLEARRETTLREVDQLGKRQVQITDQINGIQSQSGALTRQLALIADELTGQQALLDRGLAQATRVLALRREEARLAGRLGQLKADRAQAEGRRIEIDIELLKLIAGRREEAIAGLRDLEFKELELREQRLALLEQLDRMDVVAPVSGAVLGLNVHAPRAVLRPAEPILYVVPQDRPLVITTQVDPFHVDQVFRGQPVALRFSALDHRSTPELTGELIHISADAFEDRTTGASFYLAEIALSSAERARLGPDVELRPGMPVEVFLRTQDRTPLG